MELKIDRGCDTNCDFIYLTWIRHNYAKVETYEYYNQAGQLVTTSQEKTFSKVVALGYELKTAYENIQKNIQKLIYESEIPVCKDSYYR